MEAQSMELVLKISLDEVSILLNRLGPDPVSMLFGKIESLIISRRHMAGSCLYCARQGRLTRQWSGTSVPDGQFRPELASGGPSWPRDRAQSTPNHRWKIGASVTAPGDHSETSSDNLPQFWAMSTT